MKYLLFLLLPKNTLSRVVGCFARLERPRFLILFVKRWFARRYRLNIEEAELALESYPSLNAMFTRRLKSGKRPLESSLIHPCDAVISQTGPVVSGAIVQAKGWNYSVNELIGEEAMDPGQFATYYLCPTDYHRVHSPISGKLLKVKHMVGKLWPVNEWSVGNVKNLFCQNERVVFSLLSDFGMVYVVMVGATNVGQMTSIFVPGLKTNVSGKRETSFDFSQSPLQVEVGNELGVFEMGSTVVMIYPKKMQAILKLKTGPVKLGQAASQV